MMGPSGYVIFLLQEIKYFVEAYFVLNNIECNLFQSNHFYKKRAVFCKYMCPVIPGDHGYREEEI